VGGRLWGFNAKYSNRPKKKFPKGETLKAGGGGRKKRKKKKKKKRKKRKRKENTKKHGG